MKPINAKAMAVHFSKIADNVLPCDVYLVEDGGDSWTLIAEYDTAEDANHHLAILNRALIRAYAQGRRDEKHDLAETLKGDGITILRKQPEREAKS